MAFGYRIDYSGRSVVLSGDTRISENLIGHAQNVHLLIREVFARTKPKLAVYSPIVLPNATEQDLLPPTRKTYSGPLELGEDLMVIEVGEKLAQGGGVVVLQAQ